MQFIQRYSKVLWESDPGLLRTKRAFKTLLACLIALLLSLPLHNTVSSVAAGFVASFSLQGIPGATRRQQMLSMLIIGFALVLSFGVANFLQSSRIAVSLLLIAVSFSCFYLRKFGNVFNIFAISVWATCFTGTIMPSASLTETLQHTLAAGMGFSIAFLINFLVLPEHKINSYFANLKTYFDHCATQLLWLATEITQPLQTKRIKKQMLANFEDRRRLILLNQVLLETFIAPHKHLVKKLSKYYVSMYVVGKALSILTESCQQIADCQAKPSFAVTQQLAITFSYFAKFLQAIEVDNEKQCLHLSQKPEDCYDYLKDFRSTLLQGDFDEASTFLLTMHLGLQQLWHSLSEL